MSIRKRIALWLYPDLLTDLNLPKSHDDIDQYLMYRLKLQMDFRDESYRSVVHQRTELSYHWMMGRAQRCIRKYVPDRMIHDGRLSLSQVQSMFKRQAEDAFVRDLVDNLCMRPYKDKADQGKPGVLTKRYRTLKAHLRSWLREALRRFK